MRANSAAAATNFNKFRALLLRYVLRVTCCGQLGYFMYAAEALQFRAASVPADDAGPRPARRVLAVSDRLPEEAFGLNDEEVAAAAAAAAAEIAAAEVRWRLSLFLMCIHGRRFDDVELKLVAIG